MPYENPVIDRSAVNRSMNKAISFKRIGYHQEASGWAWQMVEQLHCSAILGRRAPLPRGGSQAALDHSSAAYAMSKAIAHKQIGDHMLADKWARDLVHRLHCADILK